MSAQRPVTRRRVLQIVASTGGLASAGNLRALAVSPSPITHTWRGVTLGARASITICHREPANARRLLERCIAEVRRLEDVFSLYRGGSAIVELNRRAAMDHPPPDLVHLLSLARAYADATGGAFDPTVQPLWILYARHFARPGADSHGPDRRAIDRVRALVDYRNMSVATRKIRFGHPGMGITLNGIAQGYITDRVTELLRNEGLDDVLVDLGEIRGLGRHSDGHPWTVGAKDSVSGITGETLTIDNQAVATSAGEATRFEETGRHHHLFDPHTGTSTGRFRGITVVAPTATTADALSTAFASMPVEEANKVLRGYPATTARITTHAGGVLALPKG